MTGPIDEVIERSASARRRDRTMAPAVSPTKLRLHVVSAERPLVDEEVDEVEIPGSGGYFGVLPGHTPLLAALTAGELWYRQGTGVALPGDRAGASPRCSPTA